MKTDTRRSFLAKAWVGILALPFVVKTAFAKPDNTERNEKVLDMFERNRLDSDKAANSLAKAIESYATRPTSLPADEYVLYSSNVACVRDSIPAVKEMKKNDEIEFSPFWGSMEELVRIAATNAAFLLSELHAQKHNLNDEEKRKIYHQLMQKCPL